MLNLRLLYVLRYVFSFLPKVVKLIALFCAGSVKCSSVSKEEEEEIELVRNLVSAKRRASRNIVTPTLLQESGLLQGNKFCLCWGVLFLFLFFCFCMLD